MRSDLAGRLRGVRYHYRGPHGVLCEYLQLALSIWD